MILDDDHHGRHDDVDDDELAELDELEDVVREWQHRPRITALPAAVNGVATSASTAVEQYVADSWTPATAAPSADVRALVEASIATSTRAAYESDWLEFVAWCHAHGLDDPLTANDVTVAEYVASLVRARLAHATIRRRLAGIAYAFHLTRRLSPTSSEQVRRTLKGAARTLGTAQDRAAPLRLDDMRTIIRGLPIVRPTYPGMRRDQLLVALGWAGALRPSDLVALDAEDLTPRGDPNTGDGGILLRLRRSKTDQTGAHRHVAIPYSRQWTGCPARLALTWTRRHRAGPLFRSIDRHGRRHRRLTADSVSRILKTLVAELLQTDPAPYSGQSLRAGFVTDARAHSVPDELIARHTRHAQPGRRTGGILNVYDRPDDLFERPALDPSWW